MAAIQNWLDVTLQAETIRQIIITDPWVISGTPSNLPVLVNLTTSNVSGNGTTDLTLNWTYTQPTGSGVLPATEFVIYFATGVVAAPTVASPILQVVDVAARSFVMRNVVASSSYAFGIVARRTAGATVTDTTIVSGSVWLYDGSGATSGGAYAIAQYCPGKPLGGKEVLRLPMVKTLALATNLTGSKASARVAATATTQFLIYKNGVSFGALTFAAGGTVGTFASSVPITFAFGDVLTVVAPGTADTTLEDMGFIIAGLI